MSYVSSLETKARNAYAIDVLTKLRRKLLGRENDFDDKDADILLDSLELNENRNLSSKSILYSFHGLNNYQEASALELSEVIRFTIKSLSEQNKEASEYIINLKNFLTLKEYHKPLEQVNQQERSLILELLDSAIDTIYSSVISSEWNPKEIKEL